MIKALIIEDESLAASRLEKLLTDIEPQIVVLDKLDSVESAITWFRTHGDPDLVMLDIQLADGLSFDIFKAVEVKSFIIFTTAYDEFAIKAFELNSVDYLLKPIQRDKLTNSIVKFRALKGLHAGFDVRQLISAIEGKRDNYKKRFAISIGNVINAIEVTDIAGFYTLEKNTFLSTFNGKNYPVDFSLDRLESILDPEHFFRVNRQGIVNFTAITNISILSKSRIKITVTAFNDAILVSTAKTPKFREWLDR